MGLFDGLLMGAQQPDVFSLATAGQPQYAPKQVQFNPKFALGGGGNFGDLMGAQQLPAAAMEPSQTEVMAHAIRNQVHPQIAYQALKLARLAMLSGVPIATSPVIPWQMAMAQSPNAPANPDAPSTVQMMGFPSADIATGATNVFTAQATKPFVASKLIPSCNSVNNSNINSVFITSILIGGETQTNGSGEIPLVAYQKFDELENFTRRYVAQNTTVSFTVINRGADMLRVGLSLRGHTA